MQKKQEKNQKEFTIKTDIDRHRRIYVLQPYQLLKI